MSAASRYSARLQRPPSSTQNRVDFSASLRIRPDAAIVLRKTDDPVSAGMFELVRFITGDCRGPPLNVADDRTCAVVQNTGTRVPGDLHPPYPFGPSAPSARTRNKLSPRERCATHGI